MTDITLDTLTYKQLSKVFDHAVLKPEQTKADVIEGCRLAVEYDAKSICVKPCDVKQAAALLADTDVLVGTVVSFPHGNSPTPVKVAEALQAVEDGAIEVDVVINIGHLKSGLYDECEQEIKTIIDVCTSKNSEVVFKIIFENAYLTQEEIVKACQLSVAAGAHFVKTSTGFASSGATYEDVALMRASVPAHVQVKASGGIKSLDQVIALLQKGVTRCGSSSTGQIMEEFKKRKSA
ncbi:deoxyribose-phosphate aldolase [Spinellus fusiger]|nr:deoxyribose-phosphate aldolase [Spinellus fusiger]